MSGYHILARQHALLGETDESTFGLAHGAWRLIPGLSGGIVGAVIGGSHPILGALLGSTLVRNAVDFASGDVTAKDASRRVGNHAVAAVGALAVPVAPMIGYLGGIMVGNAIFGVDAPSLDAVRAGKTKIRKGMKGDSVVYIQAVVGTVADGDFGNNTLAAVEAFQQAHSIPVNGEVDAETLAKIDKVARGDVPAAPYYVAAPTKQLPSWQQPARPAPQAAPQPRSQPQYAAPTSPRPTTPSPAPASPARLGENAFLTFAKAPVWPGAPVARWQAGLALISTLAVGGIIYNALGHGAEPSFA